MRIVDGGLPGLRLIEPDVYEDDRGFFTELWHGRRYAEAGLGATFVQDNLSCSRRGVLRGLHFQNPSPQGKLVTVLDGEVFDVAVDLRAGGPTFGQWAGHVLSAENRRQLWIPVGFAHGFVVTSASALFLYKCTGPYRRAAEAALRWDDPEIGIDWPVAAPLLSEKDRQAPLLHDLPPERLFRWEG